MLRTFSFIGATSLTLAMSTAVYAQDASTVLATVNGTEITLGHLIALQQRLPEQYRSLPDETLYDGMLEQLIQQTALAQEMEKSEDANLKLGLENEKRAFLASELLAKVGQADVSEEEIKAAYDRDFGSVEPEKEFNASHILVETKEEAEALIKQLNEGADFAKLAAEKSTGPSGPNGGELGWFGKGQMVPEFENAVMEMEAGQISEPVQTQFGWHVVKLNETRLKEAPALEDVRANIEQQVRSEAIQKKIEEVSNNAEVEKADVEIDKSAIRNLDLLK